MRRFINWFHRVFDSGKSEIERLNNYIAHLDEYIDELLEEIAKLRAEINFRVSKELTKKKRSAKVKSGGKKK